MHHEAVYLCAAIFALLGVQLGWSYRTGIFLTGVAVACASAVFIVPDDIPNWMAKVVLVAAFFEVAIQSGFFLGLVSAQRDKS